MLVLLGITRGEIPLLGPPTSIGTFHHGAVYYYLLAPAAVASAADPVAVMGWIAVFGIGAVAATWWLGRLVGGPLAALAAGVLAAVSPAGIEESTFIWNPNLIPVASALAFASALHAWQARSPRWWVLAGVGAMVTMQCHVLGIVVLPPLALAWLADVVRTRRAEEPTWPVVRAGILAALVIAASYLPLLLHEVQTDWSEVRGMLAYIEGGGRTAASPLLVTIPLVALRSLTWPIAGLLTKAGALGLVVAIAVTGLAIAALARAPHRNGARWLGATFLWASIALGVFAPGLAFIVEALPNDHYHAYLDPIVLALAGSGIAVVAAAVAARTERPSAGLAAAAAFTALLAVPAVLAMPPAVASDGGWAQARRDAVAIQAAAGTSLGLQSLPDAKSADAVGFPLARAGVAVLPADTPGVGGATPLVLVCDPVLEELIGAPCGGEAERAWLRTRGLDAAALTTVRLDGTGPRRVTTLVSTP